MKPRCRDLALVLSGGGARAAYQVGVALGIAERAGPDSRFPIITGVSAGAINAASLAGGTRALRDAARALEQAWLSLTLEGVFRSSPLALTGSALRWGFTLASGGRLPSLGERGLLDTRPLRRTLARRITPEAIDANIRRGRLRALALSSTSYTSGRTVTFVQGAEDVPTWHRAGRIAVRTRIDTDHVLASSALPLLFPAVRVDDDHFGDGSLRQTAPLAPAVHLGARRILAVALRHRSDAGQSAPESPGYPPPARVLGMLFNAVFLDAMDADAERLQRVNRSLELVPGGCPHPDGLRRIDLVVLRPSRDLGQLAGDLGPRALPATLRWLIRGLGSGRLRTPDLLSYLLFERPYIERLIELGRHDAGDQWARIAPLLEPASPAEDRAGPAQPQSREGGDGDGAGDEDRV